MIAPQIPSRVSAEVDELCDRFEDALARGERPSLDELLSAAGENRNWLLPELAALDLDYRLRSGEPVAAADYFAHFPQLFANRDAAVWLVGVEYRAALARNPSTAESDFRRRYDELARLPAWNEGPWVVLAEETTPPAALASDTTEFRPSRVNTGDFLSTILAPAERPGDLGRLGEYHIRGVLGAGGMGFVLTADDPVLRRTVAIKLMRPEVAATPGAKERFLREARSAAAVEHPRVVIIHRVGEWNGAPYLVMPLMAGRSLGARLKEGPPLSLTESVRFTREAADGLAAAHAKGLIHRDIKPDNIWLEETADGTHVRLLDFGLARGDEGEMLTKAGAVLGTPNYMAPEQASGEPVDGRADLFSLGCVLYQLLTGQMAFPGSSLMSVLSALANHQPPRPRDVSPSVPTPLSELTVRLLEKSPSRRPASAEQVSAELRRLEPTLDGNAVTVNLQRADPPPPPASRIPKWLWVAIAISVLLVIILGLSVPVVVTMLAMNRRAEQPDGKSNSPPAKDPYSSPSREKPAPEVDAGPLRVKSIEVQHYARTPAGDQPRGALGDKSFTPLLGDRVQVVAKLSKPAYAYLIALRPDGVCDICFPAEDDIEPPLTDEPKYPASSKTKAYGLQEGTGLWVFAVIASEDKLPPYRDWLAQRSDESPFWRPLSKVPTGLVWWDDGVSNVETFNALGPMTRTLRGKNEDLEGPAEHIKLITDAIRNNDSRQASSAIGFAVAPRN